MYGNLQLGSNGDFCFAQQIYRFINNTLLVILYRDHPEACPLSFYRLKHRTDGGQGHVF
ncbi:hypothetical protein D9M69_726440 [compost metagenome]